MRYMRASVLRDQEKELCILIKLFRTKNRMEEYNHVIYDQSIFFFKIGAGYWLEGPTGAPELPVRGVKSDENGI